MKKIILPVVLLAGFLGNAQSPIGGLNLVLTRSVAPSTTFTSYQDRNNKCSIINAGTFVASASGDTSTRLLNFYDFPISNYNTYNTVFFDIADRKNISRFRFHAYEGNSSSFYLFDKSQAENLLINDDGSDNIIFRMPKANSRVMIGTTSHTDGTDVYSLSVNGNVRAERVKVYNTWADYVFEDCYELPTLEEVEKHIKEKGHLIDIPSAKEVEAKGIDLGDMNRLLLQKIEELTLYTIELKKEVDQLKAATKITKE